MGRLNTPVAANLDDVDKFLADVDELLADVDRTRHVVLGQVADNPWCVTALARNSIKTETST